MKELIVTADSLKTTVDQTHYSLSVFQDDDLRRQTDRDLNDLLARIPNIEIDPLEGLIIRGLATLGSGGDQQTQLYLIDGAWTPGIFHKWDLDQLEVLRGSQSTIGSATGGTLGLKYKEPEFESSGNIMVSFEGDANDRDAGIRLVVH
jgi:outer membrane receptor protein involved in Fe transport